jgi:hypothetical protein
MSLIKKNSLLFLKACVSQSFTLDAKYLLYEFDKIALKLGSNIVLGLA